MKKTNIIERLSLKDAFEAAARYSESAMQKFGQVPPTVFLVDENGAPLLYVADSLPDGDSKAHVDMMTQLLCIAHAATAVVMTLEIWRAPMAPGDEPQHFTPSEQPDRTECVLLMGEAPGVKQHMYLPIVRYDNGRFFNFGPGEVDSDQMTGRFTQLLPSQRPNAEMRKSAKAMLQTQGNKISLRQPRPPSSYSR